MNYTPIANLKPGVHGVQVQCRVARMWNCTNPVVDNQLLSVDFLFVDKKGAAIQASVQPREAQWLRESIEEGSVYLCGGFIVITATKNYRVCENSNMLLITRRATTFQICSEEMSSTFPMNSFTFAPYDSLHERAYNNRYLSDVIGNLTSIGHIEELYIKDNPVDKRSLELQNASGESIFVTLWSSVAHQIHHLHVQELIKHDCVVVIIAAVSVAMHNGKAVLTSKSPTRVYINLPDPATTSFRLSLTRPPNFTLKSPVPTKEEQMIANRKSVSELLHLIPTKNQGTHFTCTVTIKDIHPFDGWWFPACPICRTKTKPDNGMNWCENCFAYTEDDPTHWYKLELLVKDDTADCTFIILGKHAERIIGHTVADLASKNKDKFILPDAIKQLRGTSTIFQIKPMQKNPNASSKYSNSTFFKVTQTFGIPRTLDESTKQPKNKATTSSSSVNNPATSTP